jgi:hypothetical protein
MTSVHDDLGRKYLEYMDMPEDKRGTTFNDFFDWVNVPMEQRTDFLTGAILNRAQKLIKQGF